LPSKPIVWKAQNGTAAKLLMSLGCMASPALKMYAASPDIQPSTPYSQNTTDLH